MFCPNCGRDTGDGAKFCRYCGTDLKEIMKGMEPDKQRQPEPKMQWDPTVGPEPKAQWDPAAGPEPKTQWDPTVGSEPERALEPTPNPFPDPSAGNRVTPDPMGDYDYRTLPSEHETGIRSIYLFDFLIRMTQRANIPTLIYLAVNVLIIGVIFSMVFTLPFGWGCLSALIVYLASITVALSPIGEFILRCQTGCHRLTDPHEIERLAPLFREVYYKAKLENPGISNDVRLFISDDESPNAFATGRKTMCVTKGLLSFSDDMIRATLGHEFGHLAHKDTDRILVVAIGNTIIEIIFFLIQIGVWIFHVMMNIVAIFSDHGLLVMIFNGLATFLSLVVLHGCMKLWTLFGVALCMKTSRENEYQADAFSQQLGYGDELCRTLSQLGDGPRAKGLFANLASSHPDTGKRIQRLVENGAHY